MLANPLNLSFAVSGLDTAFDYVVDFLSTDATFIALNSGTTSNSVQFDGGALNDIYSGGLGDDLLDGGGGADRLAGAGGQDIFVLRVGDGGPILSLADVLEDFEDGTDLIGLANDLQFTDLTITDNPARRRRHLLQRHRRVPGPGRRRLLKPAGQQRFHSGLRRWSLGQLSVL